MASPIRRASAYALLAAIVAAVFAAAILGGPFRAVERSDYMSYHTAVLIVRNGDGECLYSMKCQAAAQRELIGEEPTVAGGALPYNLPPWVAALLVPLAGLSLHAGFALFTILSLVLLGWAAFRLAWGSVATRLVVAALVLTAWPTVMGAIRGQSTLGVAGLLGISVATALNGIQPGAQLRSGVAAGLTAVKPTLSPLWLTWLAVSGRWRALIAAAVAVGILVAVAAVVVSPQAVLDYPGFVLDAASEPSVPGIHVAQMLNWRGVTVRLGMNGPLLATVGTIATLGILAATWRWARFSPRAPSIGAASALAATPLVIPHANQHEAILVALSLVISMAAFEELRPALARAAIGLHSVLWLGPVLDAQAAGWLLFSVTLGWVVALCLLARREGRAQARA